MRYSVVFSLLSAVLLATVSFEAGAYTWAKCKGKPIRTRFIKLGVDSCTLPPGSKPYDSVLSMVEAWNRDPTARDRISTWVVHNPKCDNRVLLRVRSTISLLSGSRRGSALGVTISSRTPCWFLGGNSYIRASRVFIYKESPPVHAYWGTMDHNNDLFFNKYIFSARSVTLHELGHVLGLEHEDHVLATMNSFYSGGQAGSASRPIQPGWDDAAGNHQLYWLPEPKEYNNVALLMTVPSSGKQGPPKERANPNLLFACPGQTVPMRVYFSNAGTLPATGDITMYFSNDKYISTSDYAAGKWIGAGLGRFSGFYHTYTVRVPELNPGLYYLGAKFDPYPKPPYVDFSGDNTLLGPLVWVMSRSSSYCSR